VCNHGAHTSSFLCRIFVHVLLSRAVLAYILYYPANGAPFSLIFPANYQGLAPLTFLRNQLYNVPVICLTQFGAPHFTVVLIQFGHLSPNQRRLDLTKTYPKQVITNLPKECEGGGGTAQCFPIEYF